MRLSRARLRCRSCTILNAVVKAAFRRACLCRPDSPGQDSRVSRAGTLTVGIFNFDFAWCLNLPDLLPRGRRDRLLRLDKGSNWIDHLIVLQVTAEWGTIPTFTKIITCSISNDTRVTYWTSSTPESRYSYPRHPTLTINSGV